jgi:hypothetical protein
LEFSLAGPLVSAICTAAVESLIRTEPVTATLCGFRQQFQRRDASYPQYSVIVGAEMASKKDGLETWTLWAVDQKHLKSFEM